MSEILNQELINTLTNSIITLLPIVVIITIIFQLLGRFDFDSFRHSDYTPTETETTSQSTMDDYMKEEPEPEPQKDDWECKYCGAINPNTVYICNICNAPKKKV